MRITATRLHEDVKAQSAADETADNARTVIVRPDSKAAKGFTHETQRVFRYQPLPARAARRDRIIACSRRIVPRVAAKSSTAPRQKCPALTAVGMRFHSGPTTMAPPELETISRILFIRKKTGGYGPSELVGAKSFRRRSQSPRDLRASCPFKDGEGTTITSSQRFEPNVSALRGEKSRHHAG